MANLEWDHTVHYVNDIEKPIEKFTENGIHAFVGGSHTQWGTYNSLSYFGLNYIEFLGVEDEELVRNISEPNQVVKDSLKWLPNYEGLSRVAIRTDDMEAIVERLDKYKLNHSRIMDGKRRNAQGEWIEWKMVTIAGNFQGLDYPFFIQWNQSDEERYESLQASKAIQRHPAGDIVVKEAVFYVNNPIEVATHWKEVFGFPQLTEGTNEVILPIGDKQFIFRKGDSENSFKQIVFDTNSSTLKGQTWRIGEGEYLF